MAKSTAERQAAYRARQAHGGDDGEGQRRVSLWVSTGCALALARLARRYGVTQRELIERMVLAEDERVLATIPSDSDEWDIYFGAKPLHRNGPDGTIFDQPINRPGGKLDQK